MPLHDVGYRGWQGSKSSLGTRWWIIAKTGVRLAFRSTWLSRTLILSWVPAFIVGIAFFAYEQSINDPQARSVVQAWIVGAQADPELAMQVMVDPEAARHDVWAAVILLFFRYPQAVVMLAVVALVAPRLISSDLRNRGYLLYFSRPLKPAGYILGKALVVCVFMGLITTVPACILYVVGLSLSPNASASLSTWDIPLRILGASLVLMIPVSSIALACSALTSETRYAVFSWFAFWVIGWVSYSVMRTAELARSGGRFRGRRGRRGDGLSEEEVAEMLQFSDWELISPFHVLGRVQQYVFGLFPEDRSIIPYMFVLVAVTVLCLWFVRRKLKLRLRG